MTPPRAPFWRLLLRLALTLAGVGLALLCAAFFAFVGWHKTTAPVEMLRQYHAWTAWLPEPLGRAVGVSELASAAVLLAAIHSRTRPLAGVAAAFLVVNQIAAAAVHLTQGETAALPQNAVLVGFLAFVAVWAAKGAGHPQRPMGEKQ